MASDVIDAPPTTPKRSASKDWLRALEMTARIEADPTRILPTVIAEVAARQGAAPALVSDRESFSFAELADRIRRYGHWARDQGLAKGDVVALLMPNRPEYLAIWLGITSIGAVVALISPSLRGSSLAHALTVAAPSRVIVDAACETALAAAAEGLSADVWVHGVSRSRAKRIDLAVEGDVPDAPPSQAPPVTLDDRALLIYTSGTTGLSKAAQVSHRRIMTWSGWFAGLMDTQPGDRLYNCLPLCHSVGGVAVTGAALVAGASVAIAEKFSAGRFWDDVVRWDCTLFQYIGELCRYLLAAPPHPNERRHRLRLVCGNGLAADVWTRFQERFAIPRILEFYASTEGAFSLFNVEGKPGAIGRIPPFLAHRFPAALVRYDPQAGAPMRGPDGFCVRCARGETGEAIGRISGAAGAGRFEGYTDAAESEKKLLRDVFAAGDAWMRTGDLMRQDGEGFFYFVDRIGDTFRWKGENVATTEVAQALCGFAGVSAASVYGVTVPGASGRAGMAALVTTSAFALARLPAHLAARLPDYARPLFLRIVPALEATETFKTRSHALAAEGFDPSRIADPLYAYDRSARAYTPLDIARFARIAAGAERL